MHQSLVQPHQDGEWLVGKEGSWAGREESENTLIIKSEVENSFPTHSRSIKGPQRIDTELI